MSKYSGMQGSFAEQIAKFADGAQEAIDTSFREIMIELGGSLIRMSPVGNPELWAANVTYRQKGKSLADAYDANVVARNALIAAKAENFTRNGNLRRGIKYAKPLTKAERHQNFDINGLVAGQGYVGGRFRGNWQFSIDIPAEGELDQVDPSGAATLSSLKAKVGSLTAGQTAYVVNNLPYAVPLEYGHSKQAPEGMVRVTVARFQQIVDEAIRNNQV